MVKPRQAKSAASRRLNKNQRRTRVSFSDALSSANRRAHDQANRKGGNRSKKFIWAAVAESDFDDEIEPTQWLRWVMRFVLGLLLLPLCWVTMWTLFSRFSEVAVDQSFWKAAEFYYFATGALVMIGWFWSGLLQSFFLYLYVLGHELTHVVFVWLFRGKVTDFHVSTEGGYITTNKTNLVIALSPYFVPFWSVVSSVAYFALRYFLTPSDELDRVFFAVMGVTWTFHLVWTVWMIPRDQPDLRQNGTFLSLVVIYLANLLVLAALLCLAAEFPLQSAGEFWMEWLRQAAISGDGFLRWANQAIADLRAAGRF